MSAKLVRRWEARAPIGAVREWLVGYREKVLPQMKSIEGCLGVSIQVSEGADPRQITVLTYWNGRSPLMEFAGSDPSVAVMPDWVAAILPDHDTFATHHEEVLLEDFQ